MKSLEQIISDNKRYTPWEAYPVEVPNAYTSGSPEELAGRFQDDIQRLLIRKVYHAQLEVFRHFGKSEGAYHKWLEEKHAERKEGEAK